MYSNIRKLKPMTVTPLTSDTSRIFINRYADAWGTIVMHQPAPYLQFAESIYYRILDHYVLNTKAMPFMHVGRGMNKAYASVTKSVANEYGTLDLRTFIQCLELSKSIPIQITQTERGGLMFIPDIVTQTYWARVQRGEAMPNLQDILDGKVSGPVLSPAGIDMATKPFTDDAVPTAEEPVSDQKFDETPKQAEPVHFGMPVPDQVIESHTSSTVRLETE